MQTEPCEPLWRTAEPRLGVAWIATTDGTGLPPGWRVQVTATYDEKMTSHVEGFGIDRRIFTSRLDFGIELRTSRGHWLPDTDYRAQRWLWRVMKAMQKGRIPDGAEGLSLDRIHQLLTRHQRPKDPPRGR